MAPNTLKPRSMSKRSSGLNEKDGVYSNKKEHRKKLSEELGSRWSKQELERFYEAYRKYGKDWKKVAAVVGNRSVEMLEALYNMNLAYLSLPEGAASVVGLIAMMTNHYDVLEKSDSERESNDAPGTQKPVKRKRGKVLLSITKDTVQPPSVASNDGYLSLSKRGHFDGELPFVVSPLPLSYREGNQTRAVGKRPCIRIKQSYGKDEVADVAALALTEAAQRGNSPQVSQIPDTRSEQKLSPVRSCETTQQESDTVPRKVYKTYVDEDYLEGGTENRRAEKGEYARDTSSLINTAGIGTINAHQKGERKYKENKGKGETVGNHLLDDNNLCLKENVDTEVTKAKPKQYCLTGQCMKKEKNTLLSEDESSALDALQTLANLSLMIPTSTMGSESSVQMEEGRTTVDKNEKAALLGGTLAGQNRDELKLPDPKLKFVHKVHDVKVSMSNNSKLGRESVNDTDTHFESIENLPLADKTWKIKSKSMASEAIDEENKNKPVIMGKHIDKEFALAKHLKSASSFKSSLSSDQKDLKLSTAEIPLVREVNLSTKQRNRRKMSLRRTFAPIEKSSGNILRSQLTKCLTSAQHSELLLKEKLPNCLSSNMVRRWCVFEWFYSAIDYPWFSKSEFIEQLKHLDFGNISRLTRFEWTVIRSALGKTRRFSEHFIRKERQKLEHYRESVRKYYADVRTGMGRLPIDLPKPLYVGQRVIALHSKTGEVHDGIVLTVDHDKCIVQFDHPELGVEFVMDIDCMPLNPLDNLPEALKRQIGAGKVPCASKAPASSSIVAKKYKSQQGYVNPSFSQTKVAIIENLNKQQAVRTQPCTLTHDQAKETDIHALSELARALDKKGDVNPSVSQTKVAIVDNLSKQRAVSTQPYTVTHDQAKKTDIHALPELARTLDKKEKLLMELKNANNAIMESQNDEDRFKDSEACYVAVSNAPLNLRLHNTYTGNSLPQCTKPQASVNVHDGLPNKLDSSLTPELGSAVIEIIEVSRLKAHAMVDAAFQASGPKLHLDSDKVDTQIPMDPITSCIATLILIQACTERKCSPADVARILDSAVTSLHPCSRQNLPMYREIQMCIQKIKTLILALPPT